MMKLHSPSCPILFSALRKATLASIVAKARTGIRFNEHTEGDGPTVFAHACKMELERHRVEAQGLALSLRALA